VALIQPEILAAGWKLRNCPMADVIDQCKGGLAVDRLGVQDLVVAQRHRMFGERNHLRAVKWKLPDDRRHLCDQTTQVVRVLELDPRDPSTALSHFSTAC